MTKNTITSMTKIDILLWTLVFFFGGGGRGIFAKFLKKTFIGGDIKISIYSCEEIYGNNIT